MDAPFPELSVLIVGREAGEADELRERLARTSKTLAPGAFEVHAGAGALERCRAPLCLLLAADGRPAPELLERHLARHLARHATTQGGAPRVLAGALAAASGQASRGGALARLLGAFDPLLALPGREPAAPAARELLRAGHTSLPTAVLRAAGGLAAGLFSERAADLDLALRLEAAGARIEPAPELVLETRHEHELEPWLAELARLGRDLARLQRRADAPALFGRPGTRTGEPLVRPFQLAFESLRAERDAARAVLAKVAGAGPELADGLAGRMDALVRRLAAGEVARGLLGELSGRDPADVQARGPQAGALTSVIVPSFNALAATRRCLDALRRHAEPGFPLELIFVDNGSQDESRAWLAEQPDVRLIANAENRGAPRARNQALAVARGEWIVFLDNDVVVTPGWLVRLRAHAEIDPYAACVGPLTDRAAHGQAVPFDGGSPDARARELARASPGGFRLAVLLSSFCLLVRRAAIDAVGGFDERFSPWGFEDDDFTLRCQLAGFHNRVALDAFVQHAGYGGAKAERHERLLEQNWRRFADKWRLAGAARGDYSGLARQLERAWERAELYVPCSAQEAEAA